MQPPAPAAVAQIGGEIERQGVEALAGQYVDFAIHFAAAQGRAVVRRRFVVTQGHLRAALQGESQRRDEQGVAQGQAQIGQAVGVKDLPVSQSAAADEPGA